MGGCGVLPTVLYLPQPRQFPLNFDTYHHSLVPLNQLYLLILFKKILSTLLKMTTLLHTAYNYLPAVPLWLLYW